MPKNYKRYNTIRKEVFKMANQLMCPKCQCQEIEFQTVEEHKKVGLLLVLWYLFLAISLIGWLVLIPIILRKKTETVTYCICKQCGNRWKLK